jgi:transcriptional regulator with XRE-family HTH domain
MCDQPVSDAVPRRSDFPRSVVRVSISDVQNVTASGPALRRERRALGLSAGEIARHFGASEPRVRQLEQQIHVRDETARRYVGALAMAQREREQRATDEAISRVERAAAGLTS